MGKIVRIILLTLAVVSCGTDGQHFRLEGRLLHFNQGEFYVYSPDGERGGVDTVQVQAGRFSYELPCRRPMTLMIVFPNYTEQPVFAEPGKEVKVEGSASNLKELKVSGTSENKLMNSFRESVVSLSPPETAQRARQFIIDHPESRVGSYLVRKYFIQAANPDYNTADSLLALMLAHQDGNGYLRQLQQRIDGRSKTAEGKAVPVFSARDINNNVISNTSLTRQKVAVVCAWASWSYESIGLLRQLETKRDEKGKGFYVMSICADPSISDCRRIIENSNIASPVVCDGEMTEGRLFRLFGFSYIPDNVLVVNGKIAARNLNADELKKRIDKLLPTHSATDAR